MAAPSTGTVACWGDNSYGQSTPPTGTYTQLSGGNNFTCAARTSGPPRCWGDNTDNRSTVPAGL